MEYITRQKTRMGVKYEVEVRLPQYGPDAGLRVHALPEMARARIESRAGYTMEEALLDMKRIDLDDEELDAIKNETASDDVLQKATKLLTPKLILFLGELCKAGIVPNPDCSCKGKGCPECDAGQMVEEFTNSSIMAVGMAVIEASTADWGAIENFSLAQKAPSTPA